MRLGCLGCLTMLVLATLAVGSAWCIVQIARSPDTAAVAGSPSDGLRAQQKIFDFLRRAEAGRPHTTSLSEPELNAFLRRHLGEDMDLPLRNLTVRLAGDGQAEIAGQMPLRHLLALPPLSALTSVIPERALEHGVWLTVLTRVTLETSDASRERRRLRLDVTRFLLGRLPLPEVMLRVLLDPSTLRFLRWPAPRAIDALRVEPGRVTLQTGS